MERMIANKVFIGQDGFNGSKAKDRGYEFKGFGDFLDFMEVGICSFIRAMLEAYAEEEFLNYIGARPYERTKGRRDYRNGYRKRAVKSRFGPIKDIKIPLGRRAGISYSSVFNRYRTKDSKIEEAVSDMFLRGVSTRKVGKITKLLWGTDISASEVSRM